MYELKLILTSLLLLVLVTCIFQYKYFFSDHNNILASSSNVNKRLINTLIEDIRKINLLNGEDDDTSRNINMLPLRETFNGKHGLKEKTLSKKALGNENVEKENKKLQKKKLIMISLGLYNNKQGEEMRGIPWNYNFTDMDGSTCPVSHCQITYNKSMLDQSDAVYFDGRIIHEFDIKQLREWRSRSSNQIWMWVMHENPNFTYYNVSHFDQFFNWSITFRPSSDIYAPYFGITKLKNDEPRPLAGTNFAEGKDKKVLVIISHCTKYRMNWIKKLKQFINVDLYGACKNVINPELPHCYRGTDHCNKLMQRYKFYLAIENFYCEDYVTEKYYKNGLVNHIVPIVLNGGNFSNTYQVFLPNSYINIEDFKDVKDLGSYLNYLDKNNTAYNSYHEWSYHYRIELKNTLCDVCKALWDNDNDKRRRRRELKLSTFWNKDSLCQSYDEPKFQKYVL